MDDETCRTAREEEAEARGNSQVVGRRSSQLASSGGACRPCDSTVRCWSGRPDSWWGSSLRSERSTVTGWRWRLTRYRTGRGVGGINSGRQTGVSVVCVVLGMWRVVWWVERRANTPPALPSALSCRAEPVGTVEGESRARSDVEMGPPTSKAPVVSTPETRCGPRRGLRSFRRLGSAVSRVAPHGPHLLAGSQTHRDCSPFSPPNRRWSVGVRSLCRVSQGDENDLVH